MGSGVWLSNLRLSVSSEQNATVLGSEMNVSVCIKQQVNGGSLVFCGLESCRTWPRGLWLGLVQAAVACVQVDRGVGC